VLLGLGILIVGGLGTFGVGIYVFHWDNAATLAVTSVLPYPAAMVNTSVVGYHDYLRVASALRKNAAAQAAQFGDSVQTFDDAEARQNALDQLVSTAMLHRVAQQRGLTVTPAEIDAMIASVVRDYGTEAVFDQTVREFYDWDRAEFTRYVLEPLLLRQALHKDISQDDSLAENVEAKTTIEQAKTRLDGGEDFATVATDLSDDISSSAGGDLGFQRLDVFPSQTFIDAVRALEVGQTSAVIQTEFGYHIVKLEEKVADAGGVTENDTYRLRHIMAETVSAEAWLDAQTRNATIRYFVPHVSSETAATETTPIP